MAVKLGVGLLVLPVLLGLVVPRAAANAETEYFKIGGQLVLKPEFSETITGITWKHKGNIVAEWIKDTVPLEYLGDLKGRTKLDLTTGTLTVSDMTKSDDGEFTVEINNRVLPDSFKAVGVNRLDEFPLEVIVKPVACSSASSECTLVCGLEFQDAGPVQYSWKFGENGEWKDDEKKIIITKAKTVDIKSYTCKAKNPVSEKVSAPVENPFIEPPGTNTGMIVGAVIGTLLIIALLVAGGVVYYIKCIKNKGFQPAGNQEPEPLPDNGAGTALKAVEGAQQPNNELQTA